MLSISYIQCDHSGYLHGARNVLSLEGLAMLSSTSGSHWDDSRRGWVSFIGGNELRGREEGGIESVILQVCHVGMIKYVLLYALCLRGERLKLRGADVLVSYYMPEVSFLFRMTAYYHSNILFHKPKDARESKRAVQTETFTMLLLGNKYSLCNAECSSPYSPVNGHISSRPCSSASRTRTLSYNVGRYVAWYF